MATKPVNNSPKSVHYGRLAWVKSNNKRDVNQYGGLQALKDAFMVHGWSINFPIPVVAKGPGELTPSQLRNEMERRQLEWDTLKENVKVKDTPDNKMRLVAFEKLFCEHPDGDGTKELVLIKPDLSANAGFRRGSHYENDENGNLVVGSCYFDSQVNRLLAQKGRDVDDNDVLTDIPINLMEYKDDAERIINQQQENELQGTGTKSMDPLEKLATTRTLFDLHCNENRIRTELYPSSTAQKMYGICQANVNWPELNIYERCFKSDDQFDSIPIKKLRGPDLVKINNRFEAQRKKERALRLTDDEKKALPISVADVDKYFRDAKAGNKGKDGVEAMSLAELQAQSKNAKIDIVGLTFGVAETNTPDALNRYADHADSINTVTKMIANGDGRKVDVVVGELVTHMDIYVLCAKLLRKGLADDIRAALDMVKENMEEAKSQPKKEPASTPVDGVAVASV